MTRTPLKDADRADDLEAAVTAYQRMAEMDPPALRSLAGELQRISDESSALAALEAGPAAHAQARRAAQRAAAANEALASVDSQAREGDS